MRQYHFIAQEHATKDPHFAGGAFLHLVELVLASRRPLCPPPPFVPWNATFNNFSTAAEDGRRPSRRALRRTGRTAVSATLYAHNTRTSDRYLCISRVRCLASCISSNPKTARRGETATDILGLSENCGIVRDIGDSPKPAAP